MVDLPQFREPECPEEKTARSCLSPGPVLDHEELGRFLYRDDHLTTDGLVAPAALPTTDLLDLSREGLSLGRLFHLTAQDIRRRAAEYEGRHSANRFSGLGAALLRRRLFRLFIGVFCSRTITFRFVLRGDSAPDSAHPPLSGLQPGLITAPGRFGRPLRPPGHSRGVLVRCIGKGDASAMAVAATTRFSGRAFWVALGAASDQGRMDRHCRRAGEAPNTVRRLRES